MTEWQEVSRDSVSVGEILRVKKNAYSTDAGTLHNGRMVTVLDVRDGDVIVRTVDNLHPMILEARHSPYKLERRVGGDHAKIA